MRKKLALLLVLALVITLVPMSAFAASNNSINKVPIVADDHVFDNVYKAPVLTIVEKNDNEFGENQPQTFRLKLENAIWIDNCAAGMEVQEGVYVERLTYTTVQVTVYARVYNSKETFQIPMLAKLTGRGEAKVTIDPRGSAVSGGTYVFAIGGSGDTVTTIDFVKSFASTCNVGTIEIDETNAGALPEGKEGTITLKLPTNFKWTAGGKLKGSGGLAGVTSNGVIDTDNNREVKFTITNYPKNRGTIGSLYITGLKLEATKNAKPGDVVMTIKGDNVTTEKIVIAKYVDYDVTVEAGDEDVAELFSGRYADDNDEEQELTTLVIKEEVENSWLTGRKTTIEFPSWVKICGVDVVASGTKGFKNPQGSIAAARERGENYIEFTLDDTGTSGTKELELQFYVSIEAGRSGDIEAVVGGKALGEEYTVVLGKAIAPVDVEVSPADVRTGIKGQDLNKIVITENKEEAIQKGELILTLEDGEWSNVPDVEVTEGDLELDIEGAEVDHNKLTIPVKSDSTEASTIEITNAAIDLHRSVPEGEIELYVGGKALVTNHEDVVDKKDDKEIAFREDAAATAVVAKVVTPADPNVGVKEVVFTIGESTFTVDGVEQTMDTAPYIKDGRTMLPVRYVAQALGVPEDNVMWNPVTRTVTIFKGDRVVLIEIGSAELKVNGTPIYMDTVAEIKDGRTMLPISFIGKALGAEVTWNADARTVTIK